ncbi:MAG: TIR domain-containing protein [Promethearchaeota archaeon]
MIYLIYSPIERPRVEKFIEELALTQYEFKMAPIGLEAGSELWKKEVTADLEDCDAVLAMLTKESVRDKTVAWRIKLASELNVRVIPVYLDKINEVRSQKSESDIIDMMLTRQTFAREADCLDYLKKAISEIKPKKRIFISYSRTDDSFAAKLATDLRQAKIKVWRDVDDIPPGANWDEEIAKILSKCTHLILIASPESVESANVLDEISFALKGKKVIIPVLFKTCELPFRIHRAQWIDFRKDYDTALKELFSRLGI